MNSNVNESSFINPNEITKRNFYLQLFRTYNDLPTGELLECFAQIYNDVFIKEKPLTIQKYCLCEIAIVELTNQTNEMQIVYQYNFANVNKLSLPFRIPLERFPTQRIPKSNFSLKK